MTDYAPGGRLDAQHQDQHHQQATDQSGAQSEAHDLSAYVISTADAMPEETIPRIITLSAANPYLRILPRDAARRRAVILPIDNDVVFVESADLAGQLAAQVAGGATAASLILGAYWSKGVVLPIESRDQMFAVATTQASTSRVSVVVERYARTTV
jgi:hypothetical protein